MFHLFVDISVDLGRILGSQQANSLGTSWAQIGEQGLGGKGRESTFVPFLQHPHPLSQEKSQEERAQLFNALLEACHIKLVLLAQRTWLSCNHTKVLSPIQIRMSG